MKMTLQLLVAITLIAAACNSNTPATETTANPKSDSADTAKNYLPVLDLIKEDIKRVDSFAGAILLRTNKENKKDSTYIDLAAFNKLTAAFLPAELEIASFQTNYKESSFVDESSQVVNFMYTSTNSNATVQKVVLYIPPSLGTDKVNRVYMEKEFKKGDTIISQKLTWKMRNYFIVAENRQTPDGKSVVTTQKAIWDVRLFNED
jgi:hypothetical protein